MTKFEKVIDLDWGVVGINQDGLLNDEFYLGFELRRKPTLGELLRAQKLFARMYNGERLWCIVDRKIERGGRFASFFGFHPTEYQTFQGTLYERTE